MRRVAAVGAILVLLSGCGDDEPKRVPTGTQHRKPTVAEARDIRATIALLEGVIARPDAPVVCRLYSSHAREQETLAYATCATAVRSDLRRAKPPRLTVGAIDVSFDPRVRPRKLAASVAVTSSAPGRDPFELDARLVQERGGWRIDDPVARYLTRSP